MICEMRVIDKIRLRRISPVHLGAILHGNKPNFLILKSKQTRQTAMSAQKARSQRSESPVSNQAQKGLGEDAPFAQRTGSYTLDIKKGELGIEATNTLHIYGTSGCACGHWAASEQGRCECEDDWDVEATTWRLAGPMLALLIICLSLRIRQSRPRIREFLANWLGKWPSSFAIRRRIRCGDREIRYPCTLPSRSRVLRGNVVRTPQKQSYPIASRASCMSTF